MPDADMKILVVDDYRTLVRIIRNLLKQIGFENADEAFDGETALGKLRAEEYGLVIADWNMDPMNGLDLSRAIRADTDLVDIPFLMVTPESKVENVVAAQEAGVSGYIVKPFNGVVLRRKIDEIFAAA